MAVDIYSKIANELVSNRYHTVLGRVSNLIETQLDEFEEDEVENATEAELDSGLNPTVEESEEVEIEEIEEDLQDMDMRMDDVQDVEDVDVYVDTEGTEALLEESDEDYDAQQVTEAPSVGVPTEDTSGRKIENITDKSTDTQVVARGFQASDTQVESTDAPNTDNFESDDSEDDLVAAEDKDEDGHMDGFETQSVDHAGDSNIQSTEKDDSKHRTAMDLMEQERETADHLEQEDVDNIEAVEDAYDPEEDAMNVEDAEEPVETDLDAKNRQEEADHPEFIINPSQQSNSEHNEGSEDLEEFFSTQLNRFGSFSNQNERSRAPPPYDGLQLTSSSRKTSMKDIAELASIGELSTSASPISSPLLFTKKEPQMRKRTPPRLPPPPKRTGVPQPTSPNPAISTTPRTAVRKSKEAERKYHQKMKTRENSGLMSEIEKAKVEIEKLRLWHKEVALRRKRTLEQERKSKQVELQEQRALELKKAEETEMKQLQRQHLIEFKRLKRAEELEARRQREEQLHTDNKVLSESIPKTPVYLHLAQIYKDKRVKKHQTQQLKRGGGGQLSPRRPKSASSESVSPPISQPSRPQKQIFKGKTAEGAKLEEQQRRVAAKLQKEGAKAKLHKQTAYAVLVKEMFSPSVDTLKRNEVKQRQATTKNRRTPSVPTGEIPHEQEPKTIPPEARGKVKPKPPPPEDRSTPSTTLKNSSALQFGNIRLVKSAKQVTEEREATVASWQARAKAVINSISQKEATLTEDVLTPIHHRFAKHAMVSSMYCDTISAKLDLLSDMRV